MAHKITKNDIHFSSHCHPTVFVIGDAGNHAWPIIITVDAPLSEAFDVARALSPAVDLAEGSADRLTLADYDGDDLEEQIAAACEGEALDWSDGAYRWRSHHEWFQEFDTLREAGAFWRAM